MTTTLAISASGRGYACALRLPDGTVIRVPEQAPHLATHVAELFERAKLAPRALEELRLDLGPGSYTGLRVAVTFARTVHALGDVAVLTATSLELLALRAWLARGVEPDRTVRVVLDARRKRFHHAAVRLGERVALTSSPAAVPEEQLLDALGEREVLLVEESVHAHIEATASRRECTVLGIETADRDALAELLLHPLLAPRATPAPELEPLYLMGTYAD